MNDSDDLARLYPPCDKFGAVAESVDAYLRHARGILPWPDDVLTQCFYDHPSCFPGQWHWINFFEMRFTKVTLSCDEVELSGLPDDSCVQGYAANFAKPGAHSARFERIHSHMLEHGSWPRPIIALRSQHFIALPGAPTLTTPNQLFEGHWRLATWVLLRSQASLPPSSHHIWLAEREPLTEAPCSNSPE